MFFDGHRPAPPRWTAPATPAGPGCRPPVLDAIAQQLAGYLEGSLDRFDLPLQLVGTELQQQVWQALLRIPYGHTVTYGELAVAVGRPTAVRAVAAANARNPLSVVVPCHRVLGADGSLTGYAGGLDRKARLLALERSGKDRRFP